MAFSPRVFAQRLYSGDKTLSGPYTFLGISGFFVIKVLRASIAIALFISDLFARGCTSETLQPPPQPKVQDVLALPSVEDLLLIGIPIIIAASFFVAVLRRIFRRHDKNNRLKLDAAIPYAFGFQYFILLPACAMQFLFMLQTIGAHTYIPDRWMPGSSIPIAALIVVLVAIAWPALILSKVLKYRIHINPEKRLNGLISRVSISIISLSVSALTLIMSLLIAYPFGRSDYEAKYVTEPVLSLTMLGKKEGLTRGATITVVMENRSQSTEIFGIKGLTIVDVEGRRYDGVITASAVDMKHLIILAPNMSTWVDIKVGDADNSPDWWGHERNYPEIAFPSPGERFSTREVPMTFGRLKFSD